MSSEHEIIRTFISILTTKIESSPVLLKSYEISSIMIGLQGLCPSHSEVQNLLSALEEKFNRFKGDLSPQGVANCIYGLQRFGLTTAPIISRFVLSITKLISRQEGILGPQGVAMVMYGLMKLGSGSDEARGLIKAILPWIKGNHVYNSKELLLSGFEVGIALSGLRNMDIAHPEVRGLIDALIYRIKCTAVDICNRRDLTLSPSDLGYALSGLRKLSNSDSDIRTLLSELMIRVDNSIMIEPDVRSISLAIHGMQHLSPSQDKNFEKLLRIFSYQLYICKERKQLLNAQGIGMILYGISNSINEFEDLSILKSLEVHIKNANFSVDHKAASLIYHALTRIDEQRLSDFVIERIESILLDVMRNLDRKLLVNVLEDDISRVLNERETNRYRNSLAILSGISKINLPPVQAWMPLLVGFFLFNEQLFEISHT